MASGIYVVMGATRMQEQRLETLSNNLANSRTAGFKQQGAVYRQIHNDVTRMGDPNQAMGLHHPHRFLPEDRLPGLLDERYTQWSQGALEQTDNPLDLALEGEGFFTLEGPDGNPIYTRNGTFTRAQDGTLVGTKGFPVLDPQGRPIRLPTEGSALQIDRTGRIVTGDGQEVGQVGVVQFEDPRILSRLGDDTYRPVDPNQAPTPAAGVEVHQGYLEAANVSPIATMTQLIKASRIFEMNVRAMQAYKAMDDAATREVGRLG